MLTGGFLTLQKMILTVLAVVMVGGGATLAVAGGGGSSYGNAGWDQYHEHDPCPRDHRYTTAPSEAGATTMVALFVHHSTPPPPPKPKPCPKPPCHDYGHWSSFELTTGGSGGYGDCDDDNCRRTAFELTGGSYGGHDDDCDDHDCRTALELTGGSSSHHDDDCDDRDDDCGRDRWSSDKKKSGKDSKDGRCRRSSSGSSLSAPLTVAA